MPRKRRIDANTHVPVAAGTPSPSADPAERAYAGRLRAAETKRVRSRVHLVEASAELFAAHGWYGTRVEDIAAAAGVSVATAYNHFENKYALLAAAYAPLLHPAISAAEADVAAGMDTTRALERCTYRLARVGRDHAAMTIAILAALPDIHARLGPPTQSDDPRIQVEYERPLEIIIEAAQVRGEVATDIDAHEVSMMVTGSLLVRVLSRPHESAKATGQLLVRMLQGGLLGEFSAAEAR
jgi:AcrR family transcriptional regulator